MKSRESRVRYFTASDSVVAAQLSIAGAWSAPLDKMLQFSAPLRTVVILLRALVIAFATGYLFLKTSDDGTMQSLPIMALFALAPAAALLSRPLSLRRQRLALVGDIDTPTDPRCGLEIVAAHLVDQLCRGTETQVIGLILPSTSGAPALLGSAGECSFRASISMHLRIEALLADTPEHSITFPQPCRWQVRRVLQIKGDGTALRSSDSLVQNMDALAKLLNVRNLVVVPLSRYQRRHGHLVVGLSGTGHRRRDVAALAQAMPELMSFIEQAALVDKLQAESEAHERARIGRDLHDSAIQPYLGLKYAIESVALRIPPNNPARAEVDALVVLVNDEVAALRELISGLRTGHSPGEKALVPAVLRQTERFALLFGIDVLVDCPDNLTTTRALADQLFHMVNEALNNIRKHSGARRVWLGMAVENGSFRLTVRDDAGSLHGRPATPFRPQSLCERVAELSGTLQVTYPDGLNTELLIHIPL